MEAIARHFFVPADPNSELGFNKDDELLILNYGDPVEWYEAEKEGERGLEKGLVPGNYIEFAPCSWYMGRISRSTAEQMLEGNKNEGAFLIRFSESSPTDFSLSVKCGESVQHFRILRGTDNKYFLWTTRFSSLNKLVEYYRTESVSRTSRICLRDLHEDNQFVAITLYDFEPKEEEEAAELHFKKDTLITVYESSDQHWWSGSSRNGSFGFFPASYVKKIQNFIPFVETGDTERG